MKILSHPATLTALVILVTVLARAYGITAESQWFDEVLVSRNLDAGSLGEFLERIRFDNPPVSPLYFALIYFWNLLNPGDLLWLRAFSVLIGAATGVLILRLGTRYISTEAGLLAALLHAFAQDTVYYGQEVRMYALTVLLGTVVLAIFFRILKASDDDASTTWLWCGLSCGVSSLLFQTHILAFFLLCAEALALLILRWRRPRLVIAFATMHAIAVVPPLLWVLNWEQQAVDQGTQWIEKSPAFAGPQSFLWMSTWTPPSVLLWSTTGTVYAAVILAVMLFVLAVVLRDATRERRETIVVLALCAWVPVILLQLGTVLVQPMFIPRYILYSIVPFFLLVGAVVAGLDRPDVRRAIVVLLVLLSVAVLATLQRPFRTNWIDAEVYLRQRIEEGALVVIVHGIEQTAASAVLPVDTAHGVLHARNRTASLSLPVVLADAGKTVLLTGTRMGIDRLRWVSEEAALAALPVGALHEPERVFSARMNDVEIYAITFPETEDE